MKSRATILITGANGYLGSNILRAVVNIYKVIILVRSFSNLSRIGDVLPHCKVYYIDQTKVEEVFTENRIDYVLHCATHYGRRDTNPLETIEANLLYPLKLLLLAVQHGVSHFVNTDTILDKRVSQYSLSKKQFLDWLLRYKNEINVINVRLEHFFGPGDDESKFVTRMISDCLSGVAEISLTKGEQKRDFIFVSDVVRAFLCILEHYRFKSDGFAEYEVGSGKSISIRYFCSLIKALSGNQTTRLIFGAIPYRENELMDSCVNIAELQKIGWSPAVTLEEGLAETIRKEKESRL